MPIFYIKKKYNYIYEVIVFSVCQVAALCILCGRKLRGDGGRGPLRNGNAALDTRHSLTCLAMFPVTRESRYSKHHDVIEESR